MKGGGVIQYGAFQMLPSDNKCSHSIKMLNAFFTLFLIMTETLYCAETLTRWLFPSMYVLIHRK